MTTYNIIIGEMDVAHAAYVTYVTHTYVTHVTHTYVTYVTHTYVTYVTHAKNTTQMTHMKSEALYTQHMTKYNAIIWGMHMPNVTYMTHAKNTTQMTHMQSKALYT